jgi:hypothetical protein
MVLLDVVSRLSWEASTQIGIWTFSTSDGTAMAGAWTAALKAFRQHQITETILPPSVVIVQLVWNDS